MRVRVVDIAGEPGERGLQHGRALRDEIAQCLAIYQVAIGRSEEELRERARAIEAEVRRYAPDLAAEIEGIAEGAGVEPYKIYVLNARSELMSGADGCTAVFAPGAGLLGQTWDWIDHSAGPLAENSEARLARGRALVAADPPADAEALGSILSDGEDAAHPICAPYVPLLGTRIGTVCTVVMDLAARCLLVRRGPDRDAPFTDRARRALLSEPRSPPP